MLIIRFKNNKIIAIYENRILLLFNQVIKIYIKVNDHSKE